MSVATRSIGATSWAGAPGSSTLQFQATMTAGTGQVVSPDKYYLQYSPSIQRIVDLSSGANTISFNANARAFYIELPSGNTTGVTVKGVTADTGWAMHPNGALFATIPSSTPSICLTAAGDITGVKIWEW